MDLTSKVLQGDVLAAARLMRGFEDEAPETMQELELLYPHTGRAMTVGVAGAPGAGKSTLLDSLINIFREKNMKVGVVAVDPSSPFTGGAVLGDRIRMQSRSTDKDVFIRSLATRGWKGGLAKATVNMMHVLDAMGKDIIFVESVGSGQAEVDIAKVTDTAIIVLVPGMGDEIQTMKAGILEAADVFVINKASRDGAENLRTSIEVMLMMKEADFPGGWKPRILLTEALLNKGIEEVADEILRHREYLISSGELEKRRRQKARLELMMAVESCLTSHFDQMDEKRLDKLVASIYQRKIDPNTAALKILNSSKGR